MLGLSFLLIAAGLMLIIAGYQGRSLKNEAMQAFGKKA